MKHNFFSALLLTASLTIFIACGNSGDKTAGADNKKEESGNAANAGNASDCGTTSFSFGTEGVSTEGVALKYSEAILWNMASGETKYPAIVIQGSTYDKEGSYLQSPAKDGDVRFMFTISGKAGEKLKVGDYDIAGNGGFGAGNAVSGGIENKDANKGFVNATGKATITYLADDKVCGTIDIKDSKTFIKGSFSMALTKSAY